MKLVNLDASLIFKSLLVVVYYVKLVFVILEEETPLVNQVTHVAFQVEHNASDLFNDSIDGKQLVTHLFEKGCTLTAHTDARGLIEVGHLIHVVIGAGIRDTRSPGDSCRKSPGRHEAACILRHLLLDGPVEIQEGLDLG